jgi:hypothetical protein
MNRDLGVWTYEDCALVLIDYWYFTDAPKLTSDVGVAEAEKPQAAAAGLGAG